MIKEYLIKKLLDTAIESGKKVLTESKSNLKQTRENIEASINIHVNSINNWAKTISFNDLKQSKLTYNVYIHLDLFVHPRRLWFQNENEIIEKIDIERIFEKEIKHFIILGQPGAGKTTSMKYLCQKIFLESDFYPDKFSMPILVKLREINSTRNVADSTPIISELINILGLNIDFPEQLKTDASLEERRWIKEKLVINFLEELKALIILDGFDEIFGNFKRNQVLRDISKLASHLKQSSLVVTSRTGDFNYSIDNTKQFEISPLSDDQIKSFAKKWLANEKEAMNFYEKVHNSPFADTAIRPLTLAHLCAIYERIGDIPNKPKTVYKKVVNLLLEEWDQQRTVTRKSNYASFEVDRKFEFLCHLAYILTTKIKKSNFTSDELLQVYYNIFENYDLQKNEAKQVVSELESHTGLILQSGYESYEFAHKSLQEYLTAEYIVRLPNIINNEKIILKIPNELAIATTISSNPSEYFNQLVFQRLMKMTLPNEFMKPFLSRLILEKPDFNNSLSLGFSLVILYSKHIAENVIGENQMKLFAYDEVINEYEKIVALIFQRTSLNFISQKYKIDNSHKFEVDEHPIVVMKLQSQNLSTSKRGVGELKYPKELFVRESLLQKIDYKS